MSDYTKTKNYDLYLPVPNADSDVWGDHLNANTTTLDGLIKSVSDKSGVVTFNTRAGAVTLTNADVVTALPPGSSPPTMDGTASAGTATAWSRQDHVHPTDTTRAPLNSPVFTGVPVMPTGTQAVTQTAGTSNQTLATTQFVTTSLGANPGGATIAPTAPALNPGGLWWDSTGGQLYVRYDDGTSVAYVAATNVEGLANAATKAEVGAALNNSGRNLIHNGLFNIAQRGTGPFTTIGYTTDRWTVSFAGGTTAVYIQSTGDASRAAIGDEAAATQCAHVVAGGAAAGDYYQFLQRIEKVLRLSGKTVTISFWAIGSAALKVGVSFVQVFGTGGSPSAVVYGAGQAVTISTGWQRYSLTFALPSASGKTLGANGDDFTQATIWLSSGVNNAGGAGNVGVQSGTFTFWGVQLEIAAAGQTQPSPLDKPDPQVDLANCQRFYQVGQILAGTYAPAGVPVYQGQGLVVSMRGAPTAVVTLNSSAGLSGQTITADGLKVFLSATTAAVGTYIFNANYSLSADL